MQPNSTSNMVMTKTWFSQTLEHFQNQETKEGLTAYKKKKKCNHSSWKESQVFPPL